MLNDDEIIEELSIYREEFLAELHEKRGGIPLKDALQMRILLFIARILIRILMK